MTSGDLDLPVPGVSSDAREVSVTDRTNVRFCLAVCLLESFGDAEAAMATPAGRFIMIKRGISNAILTLTKLATRQYMIRIHSSSGSGKGNNSSSSSSSY